MKLTEIIREAVSEEDHAKFRAWQLDCRKEAPDCQFAGSIGMGAQAVDWTTANNRCVGDWDADTMSGVVHKKSADKK